MKYIGIRGHRGSGKNSISRLLGLALQYYHNNKCFDEAFDKQYTELCHNLIKDKEYYNNVWFDNIYFDNFSDNLKIIISQIFNVDVNLLFTDEFKDNKYINLKDFKIYDLSNIDKNQITNYKNLFEKRLNEMDVETSPKIFKDDLYLSFREFVMYMGWMFQNFLGKNIWVKLIKLNDLRMDEFFNNIKYKIYCDVKSPSEISYIREKQGIIIKLYRPNNIKNDTDVSQQIDYDNRVDFTIDIDGTLEDIKDQIKQLAIMICENL